jgi:hypothetical protein
MDLKSLIRDIPDFPKPGILFRDITTLLRDPAGLRYTLDRLTETTRDLQPDYIIGMESRGFIFGVPLPIASTSASSPPASPTNSPAPPTAPSTNSNTAATNSKSTKTPSPKTAASSSSMTSSPPEAPPPPPPT